MHHPVRSRVFPGAGLKARLFALLAGMAAVAAVAFPSPAAAGFALALPDTPLVTDPEQKTLKLTLSTLEPFFGEAVPMERPQALTALRFHGEETDRTEHLSVLEEITAWGEPAFSAEIALPQPGVYHFILQTKARWLADEDKFIQYVSKVEIPVLGSSEGWDKDAGLGFEILPLSRPFGLCAGMSFTGRVLLDGKPLSGALVTATWLNTAVKPDIRPAPTPEEAADAGADPAKKTKTAKKPVPSSPYQPVQELRADENGVFTFACPLAGWWAFAAKHTGDPLQDPEGKLKPLETKTIFWVFLDPCKDRARR